MVSVGKEYRRTLFSGVRGDLSWVTDSFRCRRCDGAIQEVHLAEDIMVNGETYECVKQSLRRGLSTNSGLVCM